MNKKVFVLAGALGLVTSPVFAQRPFNIGKQLTQAMTGGVSSAFSRVSPVSFVRAEVIEGHIARAQFAQTNQVYISSLDLFKRVVPLSSMQKLPAAERKALEMKFAQLDLAVKTAQNEPLGYTGALWGTSPAVRAETLQAAHVQSMTQLLDIQRYMQLNDHNFPQVFSVNEGGWLQTTNCLTTVEGNRAFLGVVDLLVKEQSGRVPQAIVEQLVSLHASARNAVPFAQLVKQLENWRSASMSGDAPRLPSHVEGVSLRNNPEALWLAAEIRLWQLTPDIELPEILKNAQVTR